MPKIKKWNVEHSGQHYEVTHQRSIWTGKSTLTINSEEITIPKNGLQSFAGTDIPVMLGDKEIRFVLVGGKADLAIDDKYLDSGKEYKPLGKVPWWAWLFAVLCILVFVVAQGGALPFLIGFGGAVSCLRLSIQPTMKTFSKILLCIIVTIITWILLGVLVLAIAALSM